MNKLSRVNNNKIIKWKRRYYKWKTETKSENISCVRKVH